MNQINQEFRSRILVLDTETGGLNPDQHSLLSIGLVSWDQRHQRELFVAEPQLRFDPRSMEVNGIDLDWIRREGLHPLRACEALEAFIDEIEAPRPFLIAGHNISFDLAFIRRLYRVAQRPLPSAFSHRSIDTHTLLWALAAVGRLPKEACSSDGAFRHFDVAPPQELRHTALGDAVATRALLERLLDELAMSGSAFSAAALSALG